MLVVSLSSIPPRFAKIGPTLHSLLAQRERPDQVILYIPRSYRRFPDWDGTLPEVPSGVELRRCDEDLGPATKILPALRDFADQDVDIVYCDDDRVYPPEWLSKLRSTARARPGCAVAPLGFMANEVAEATLENRRVGTVERSWRITDVEFQLGYLWRQIRLGTRWREADPPWRRAYKRSGFVDIVEGCGGVMVRPEHFNEAVFDIPQKYWMVDDIWLSGMLWVAGTPIWLIGNQFPPKYSEANAIEPLAKNVVGGFDRDTANRQTVEYFQQTYGIWA